MDKELSAKKAAYAILRQYKISTPTLDELLFLIKSYGFEVIDYELDSGHGSVDALVNELSLQPFAVTGKAFTYQKSEVKLIFVCDSMTPEEKKYALAHELGHIVCGHMKNGLCNKADMTEEFEANEFAHYLLYPGMGIKFNKWVHTHKILSLIALVVLIVGIAAISILHQISLEKTYYEEYYVTENGEKYHDENCIYIKDKNNVHRLTIEEYETGEFEPCQICLPDIWEKKKEDQK